MKLIKLIIVFLLFSYSVFSQNKKYYIEKKTKWETNTSGYLSLGSINYSNNGLYFSLMDTKFSLDHNRLFLATNILRYYPSFAQKYIINDTTYISDKGEYGQAFVIRLGYDIFNIQRGNCTSFEPFTFSVSVFCETWPVTAGDILKDNVGNPQYSFFSSFNGGKFGISAKSSVFNFELSYLYLPKIIDDNDNYYFQKQSIINLSAGINLLFFSKINGEAPDCRKYIARKKNFLPNFKIPKSIISKGNHGNAITENDNGYIQIPLENIGKGTAKSVNVEIKKWADYPGLSVQLQNNHIRNLGKGQSYTIIPKVTTRNAIPGEKKISILLTGNDNYFQQEIPITFSILPDTKDEPVTTIRYFDPTELDYNIPIGKQQPNRKALLVLIDHFDNKTIEPIIVGYNVINTLEKYVKNSFGISDIIKKEDLSIYQFGELFDSDYGTIAQWVDENTELFIYILSHGMVDKKQTNLTKSYILCKDSNPKSAKSPGYSVNKLIANLDELNIKNYVLVIDACYSGTGKGTLSAGMQMKTGLLNPKNGLIISSSGENVSYLLEDKGHTAFSYYFLKSTKKLGNEKRHSDISINQIFEDMKKDKSGIGHFTIKKYNQKQVPQIFGKKEIKLIDK